MKTKPISIVTAKQKAGGSTRDATAIIEVPAAPVTEAIHTTEHPGARGTHGSPGRSEIRKTTHRVMGSRQSQRPLERHNQPRQKRG